MASEVPPPPGDEAPAGSVPAEVFERLGTLEILSYGVLYDGRAYRASRSEPLALLELDPGFSQEDVVGRLSAEIESASKLKDANILTPRGLYRSGESLYVVYDAQTGISLAAAFQMLASSGLRLSAEAILRIAGAVLAALDQAAGSSGRDDPFSCHGFLTPENIFIAEGQRVLVRGFGLWAGGIGRLKLVGPNEARYLTPSHNRAEAASPRADLFSLGTILFEAVSGVAAFDGPPDEEAVMSLRDSVAESKNQGGPSLQALYAVVDSCLTANPPIPGFRARLRTTVDTLFLGELSHERVAKTLSLEELLGRVRPKRPAVIKAKSISLSRVEGAPEVAAATAPTTPISETNSPSSPSVGEPVKVPAERPTKPPPPRSPMAERSRDDAATSASHGFWLLAAVVVLGGILGVFLLRSNPRSDHESGKSAGGTLPSPAAENPWPPAALPTSIEATPAVAEVPPAIPEAAPPTEPPRSARARASEGRKRPTAPPRVARGKETGDRARPLAPQAPPSSPSGGAAVASSEPAAAAPVSAGSLVPLETAGLVRPVLLTAGETLRFGSGSATERSVQLQILVDDNGRVRANRILRADRMPEGFGQAMVRYLSTLRFQPAQVGGVPVRVWIPYELRFYAP